jgi:flavin-dependent dehydrogenase
MTLRDTYDVAVVGGGLAGLAAAIRLADSGRSVVLFEKEKYPYHKVCGEYISFESAGFLELLGVPLHALQLPEIHRLFLSAPNGRSVSVPLATGGFGISRYKLDHLLARLARSKGVEVLEEAKVEAVRFDGLFQVQFRSNEVPVRTVQAQVCFGAYGKRSNLDVQWKRPFLNAADRRLNNYIGVKYHVKADWPAGVIGLHNFQDGYCGISRIEEEKYCLCYLTTAALLKQNGGDVHLLQRNVLGKNPHLKKIFAEAEFFDPSFPVTIAQISFSKKCRVEQHVLMLGDAAGMITPLCGNGMSIALHTAKIASEQALDFLEGRIGREALEQGYDRAWRRQFSTRLSTGRTLQAFFGSPRLSNLLVQTASALPGLARQLVRRTHGSPF